MLLRKVSSIAIAGAFLISTAGLLLARDHDDKCEERIHKAERNLEKAEHKHGEHSKQAEKQRKELDEAREKCGHHDHDRDHH